jgi:hypothetical protein
MNEGRKEGSKGKGRGEQTGLGDFVVGGAEVGAGGDDGHVRVHVLVEVQRLQPEACVIDVRWCSVVFGLGGWSVSLVLWLVGCGWVDGFMWEVVVLAVVTVGV